MSDRERDYSGHRPPNEESRIIGEQAGHQPPQIEAKIVHPDQGKSGHVPPDGNSPVQGSGHPAPVRLDPMNVAPQTPPPKRDDAGPSGKPPAK